MRHVAILGLVLGSVIGSFGALSGTARADSIDLYGGGSGVTSSWDDDSALMSMGRLGWRFGDRVGVHLLSHAGYAGVNHRMITAVGAGGQMWTAAGRARPYLRGAVVRTAEQPFMNLANDPLGAVLATGDNVIHRFGIEAGAGVDVTLVRGRKIEIYGSADLSVMMFRDDVKAPETYTALGVGLGVRLHLGKHVTPFKL